MAKHRIPAPAYWDVVDAIEDGKKLAKEAEAWQRAYVKGKGLYLDSVNFGTGVITKLQPSGAYKAVGHIPQADLDKAHEMVDAVRDANDEIDHKINALAKRYTVFPDQINIKTGEVAESDFETMKEPEKEEA